MYVKLKNGNVYAAGPENDGILFIYTKHAKKADGSFEKTEHGYRRKITLHDDDVEEYFSMNWKFKLDIGIDGVPDEWSVGQDSDLQRGKVILWYGVGNIQGWVQEDRGVCHREYDFNLSTAWWVEKYTAACDGEEPSDAGWKRIPLTKEKFVEGYLFYNSSTL